MRSNSKLEKGLNKGLFDKAKAFSDYLGFYARAFFFFAVGCFSFLSHNEFAGLLSVGLIAVSIVCFAMALAMMSFAIGIASNPDNSFRFWFDSRFVVLVVTWNSLRKAYRPGVLVCLAFCDLRPIRSSGRGTSAMRYGLDFGTTVLLPSLESRSPKKALAESQTVQAGKAPGRWLALLRLSGLIFGGQVRMTSGRRANVTKAPDRSVRPGVCSAPFGLGADSGTMAQVSVDPRLQLRQQDDALLLMRLGAAARGHRQQVHAHTRRTGRLFRDAFESGKTLFALKSSTRAQFHAIHHGNPSYV